MGDKFKRIGVKMDGENMEACRVNVSYFLLSKNNGPWDQVESGGR